MLGTAPMRDHSAEPAIAVVRRAYEVWAAHDIEGTLALCSPDIVYVLHLDPKVIPFGGERHGIAALRELLDALRSEFIYLRFVASGFTAADGVVRFRVDYSYRHKVSGVILSDRYSVAARVGNGQIVHIEEYPDAGFVEAFYRMVASPPTDAEG